MDAHHALSTVLGYLGTPHDFRELNISILSRVWVRIFVGLTFFLAVTIETVFWFKWENKRGFFPLQAHILLGNRDYDRLRGETITGSINKSTALFQACFSI